MSKLIPMDLGEELERILADRPRHLVYTEVDGVPIVGVPVDSLVADDLDDALDPRLGELFTD